MGMRLKYSNPVHLDDVALDFPDMKIILAHPSFPWTEEGLAVRQHQPNVYYDMSAPSPAFAKVGDGNAISQSKHRSRNTEDLVSGSMPFGRCLRHGFFFPHFGFGRTSWMRPRPRLSQPGNADCSSGSASWKASASKLSATDPNGKKRCSGLKAGASALLAVKCCLEKMRWPAFLEWRACRASAA